jgi:hypothetical protein
VVDDADTGQRTDDAVRREIATFRARRRSGESCSHALSQNRDSGESTLAHHTVGSVPETRAQSGWSLESSGDEGAPDACGITGSRR